VTSLSSSVMPAYIADLKPSVGVSAHTHTLKPYNLGLLFYVRYK
jgi:hypothetical protein